MKLPCDVHLPPNTYIRKGVDVETLLTAIKLREKFPVEATVFTKPPCEDCSSFDFSCTGKCLEPK